MMFVKKIASSLILGSLGYAVFQMSGTAHADQFSDAARNNACSVYNALSLGDRADEFKSALQNATHQSTSTAVNLGLFAARVGCFGANDNNVMGQLLHGHSSHNQGVDQWFGHDNRDTTGGQLNELLKNVTQQINSRNAQRPPAQHDSPTPSLNLPRLNPPAAQPDAPQRPSEIINNIINPHSTSPQDTTPRANPPLISHI